MGCESFCEAVHYWECKACVALLFNLGYQFFTKSIFLNEIAGYAAKFIIGDKFRSI